MCLSRVNPPEKCKFLLPREEKVRLSALRDLRRSVHDHETTMLHTLFIYLAFCSPLLLFFVFFFFFFSFFRKRGIRVQCVILGCVQFCFSCKTTITARFEPNYYSRLLGYPITVSRHRHLSIILSIRVLRDIFYCFLFLG